jgi:predicted nucleic acid-binding protein
MPKKVLVDTGFWIALLNERDKHYANAQELEDLLSIHTLLVPWPTLFECMDTRLFRRKQNAIRLRHFLLRPSTILVDDSPYRNESLEFTLRQPHQTFSLTDHVLRSMIADPDLAIDAFVGFNPRDFYDVCADHNVELISADE